MNNWNYTTRDVKRVCESKLRISFSEKGKECNGWFLLNGVKTKRVTVAKGRKDVPPGTYNSIAKQLGIHHTQLDDLLACPLSRSGYEALIRRG